MVLVLADVLAYVGAAALPLSAMPARMRESPSDREYHAAQAMGLFQRLGDDREAILRIVQMMDRYGTTPEQGPFRMSDQSFWMWMCGEHPDDVIAWERELQSIGEDARHAHTAAFREGFEDEFRVAAETNDE